MTHHSLTVDRIERGLVIDHISAGSGMKIYHHLNLDDLDCAVAMIRNVKSGKYGHKDIIKIENNIYLDLNVLGYLDPNITVNVIEDGVITGKQKLILPTRIRNIVKCKNPRCITSIEQEVDHIFELTNEGARSYRCVYCEQAAPKTE
ncbi:MAG: aspartate carbamoyltransferase regulatory subunit [Clostridiales bacterium]|jgi:aspartate carbamoyltransferase regulatory subunit|nr:aspartate carbamoyltransferase regulatory subunit [Clostridiales bacterium]